MSAVPLSIRNEERKAQWVSERRTAIYTAEDTQSRLTFCPNVEEDRVEAVLFDLGLLSLFKNVASQHCESENVLGTLWLTCCECQMFDSCICLVILLLRAQTIWC